MPKDTYTATWMSHSSAGDFLKCPRLYYLRNKYKDPKTGRKINSVSPALALGVAVHEVLEGLIVYKAEERMNRKLAPLLEKAWQKVSGKMGGFKTVEEELFLKERALAMLRRVEEHPGPFLHKALRLPGGIMKDLPSYYLSEEENIILCGKVDWLEYLPETDGVHVIDFKTGKNEESEDSLQLPMYLLLISKLQKRKVEKASYWYLDRDDVSVEKPLPEIGAAYERVFAVGKKMKEANDTKKYECPRGKNGCFGCLPFERILRGEAEYVGRGEYGTDMYMLP